MKTFGEVRTLTLVYYIFIAIRYKNDLFNLIEKIVDVSYDFKIVLSYIILLWIVMDYFYS